MKKIIFFLILLIFIVSCKTNNYLKYHRYVNEAEYSFFNEDYQTASKLYGKAFQKVPVPFEEHMYFYAASLWETGDHVTSIQLLDTMYGVEWTLTKSGFFQGMDSLVRNEVIRKNKEKMVGIDARRNHHPLLAVFDTIEKRDQKPRLEYNQNYHIYALDTVKCEQIMREIALIDSLNLLTIDSLIQIHGFIGGVHFPSNPRIMHLTMLHQLEWVYENKKLFKKAIKQGRLLPVDYAISYDKALLNMGDTVTYYGQFSNKIFGVDPKNIFKRSVKMGISPYYLKWVRLPKIKGYELKKHPYYDQYAERKKKFNCTKRFRL